MITVLALGCFDILHIGHLKHLEAAKRLGDRLVIALTVDEHVNKGPGLPIHTWEHRAELLRGLRCVDEVVPSYGDCAAIRAIRPDVFVKGIDYVNSPLLDEAKQACEEVGAVLVVTQTPKWSSRAILERMGVC